MTKRTKIIIAVLIGLAAIGGGLYYYFGIYKKKVATPPVKEPLTAQQLATVRPLAPTE